MDMETVLTQDEIQVLHHVEAYWNLHGKWPATFPRKNIPPVGSFVLEESLQKQKFIKGLKNRGIALPHADLTLTDEQLAAILAVVNIDDRRSRSAKLKDMGIAAATFAGWMKNPEFKQYLHSLSAQTFEDAIHVANEGLLKAVDKGDVNAIKYYNELTGRVVSPEVHNARVLISRLVQVIQTHVKDQGTLNLIARDFDSVMRGEEPSKPLEIGLL
jgi:hypothetical protein